MNFGSKPATASLILVLGVLGACASLPENLIEKPDVELSDVGIMGLGFNSQTFLLSLAIRNPNPFPLPINHISFGVKLAGQRFASGETASNVSVPARGYAEFAISVELDLLGTAPQLLSIVRESRRRDIPYVLEGELGVDIPMTPPVSYRTDGQIRVGSGGS